MRNLVITVMALLLLASSASAGNVVKQSIDMSARGSQISQSAANAAIVSGNNNYVSRASPRQPGEARSPRVELMPWW